MSVPAAVLARGAAAGSRLEGIAASARGSGASAVRASGRMPRQPGYLTREQAAQLRSDQAEYQAMQRTEAGRGQRRRQRAARAARSAGQVPARAISAVRSSGLRRESAVSRLLTALAVGAIALEVMSYVTGQYFSVDWRGLGQRPLEPEAARRGYLPLYAGQAQELARIATAQAPATRQQQSTAAQLWHAQGPL